jgi:hypothetical protein
MDRKEVRKNRDIKRILSDMLRSIQERKYTGDFSVEQMMERINDLLKKPEFDEKTTLGRILRFCRNHYKRLKSGGLNTKNKNTSDGIAIEKLDATKLDLGRSRSYDQKKKSVIKNTGYKDVPLFEHVPSIEDIQQGSLGDCYWLAALASEVQRDPARVVNHMRDNGDNTVTVRFYRKRKKKDIGIFNKQKNGDDEIVQPVDVTVTKDLDEKRGGGAIYARGPLWVRLMEKAYAASGLNQVDKLSDQMQSQADLSQIKGTYRSMEGGLSSNAAIHLTGQDYGKRNISPEKEDTDSLLVKSLKRMLHLGKNDSLKKKLMKRYHLEENSADELVKNLEQAQEKYHEQGEETDNNGKKKKVTYQRAAAGIDDVILAVLQGTLKFKKHQTLEGNRRKQRKLANQIANELSHSKAHRLHFAPFTGEYSDYAIETYNSIKKACKNNQPVEVGTKKFLPRNVKATGRNGEPMDDGIVQGHAYSVVGVRKKGRNRFVVLRNPWASGETVYSRQADGSVTADIAAKSRSAGIFLMELNDFMRKIGRLYGVEHDDKDQKA